MSPRPRFHDLDPDRREGILLAAAREFTDRGYEGASVNRVIEAAGISKGTLYYYFDDKEDLFATALEYAQDRLFEAVGMPRVEELEADTFWESFRDVPRQATRYTEEHEWFVRLARSFHRFREEHGTSEALARVGDRGREILEAVIARGQELGVVRSDMPRPLLVTLARAVDLAGDRWTMEHWDEYGTDGMQKIGEARLDLLRDMLDTRHEGWER